MKLRLFAVAIACMFPLLVLHAETGALRGKVSPNARIRIRTTEGVLVTEINADGDGGFLLELPLGEYRLDIVEASGTASTVFRMIPGITAVSVTEGQANLSAIILDDRFLRNVLPDDPFDLALSLSTFTATGGFGVQAPGVSGRGSLIQRPRIPGPRLSLVRAADVLVNGEPSVLPPKDQTREVWIDNNPFTAEFSNPSFARINAVTQDGSNVLHGSAAFDFRDESLSASSPIPGTSDSRFPYQSRYWHGVVNGPLVRDRLFVSAYAERHGEDNGSVRINAVTPDGVIDQRLDLGWADQTFNPRLKFAIADGHTLHVTGLYRVLRMPIGSGGLTLPERGTNRLEEHVEAAARETDFLNPATVHELRMNYRRDRTASRPVKEGIGIDVLGAFSGGGTSGVADSSNAVYQFGNLVSRAANTWTLRAGAEARRIDIRSNNSSNTLGTFTFASLNDYNAGRPITFSQFRGSVSSSVRQSEFSAFVQTDWRVRPRFVVSAGVRFESQTNLHDRNNVDPRAGVAFMLRPSWTIRTGGGVFHDRLAASELAGIRSLTATRQTVIFLSNPSYPDPFAATLVPQTGSTPVQVAGVDRLVAPYVILGEVSLEKMVPSGTILSASSDFIRRVHDPRVIFTFQGNQRTYVYGPSADLFAKHLILHFRSQTLQSSALRFRVDGDYTFGRTRDNAAVSGQWARSGTDIRHTLWVAATIDGPRRTSLSLLVHANSGIPIDVTPAPTRNSGDGPNYASLDARLSKSIRNVSLFIYGQNILNSRNFLLAYPDANSLTFGDPFAPSPARMVELGVRLRF